MVDAIYFKSNKKCFRLAIKERSSLIYNTSARHERYDATRVRHEWNMRNTSATRTTQVQHECYTNDTIAKRVKKFDFDNDTNKNIFSHHYIYYMASERFQGEEQFHCKNYLLKMPCSHAKIRFKSAPKSLKVLMAKDVSKSYTLDCSCSLMPLHVPA